MMLQILLLVRTSSDRSDLNVLAYSSLSKAIKPARSPTQSFSLLNYRPACVIQGCPVSLLDAVMAEGTVKTTEKRISSRRTSMQRTRCELATLRQPSTYMQQ